MEFGIGGGFFGEGHGLRLDDSHATLSRDRAAANAREHLPLVLARIRVGESLPPIASGAGFRREMR
jgi:hypothetical protein